MKKAKRRKTTTVPTSKSISFVSGSGWSSCDKGLLASRVDRSSQQTTDYFILTNMTPTSPSTRSQNMTVSEIQSSSDIPEEQQQPQQPPHEPSLVSPPPSTRKSFQSFSRMTAARPSHRRRSMSDIPAPSDEDSSYGEHREEDDDRQKEVDIEKLSPMHAPKAKVGTRGRQSGNPSNFTQALLRFQKADQGSPSHSYSSLNHTPVAPLSQTPPSPEGKGEQEQEQEQEHDVTTTPSPVVDSPRRKWDSNSSHSAATATATATPTRPVAPPLHSSLHTPRPSTAKNTTTTRRGSLLLGSFHNNNTYHSTSSVSTDYHSTLQTPRSAAFLTPSSARTSKKRLSSKLAERCSKFERASPSMMSITGNNNSQSTLEVVVNHSSLEESELSPMNSGSWHHGNNTILNNSSHHHPPPPLSSTGRPNWARRNYIHDRIQTFSPKKESNSGRGINASCLLSPQQVKKLVLSSSSNKRLSNIKSNFERHGGTTATDSSVSSSSPNTSINLQQQRQDLQQLSQAKEQQRLACLQKNKEERRAQWEATRRKFGEAIHYSTTTMMIAKEQEEEPHSSINPPKPQSTLLYQKVRIAPIDLQSFVAPQHGAKTEHQTQLILKTVERNFIFSEFRNKGKARSESSIQALLDAFEVIQVNSTSSLGGELNLWNPGDVEEQAFYIIETGQVAFVHQADGRTLTTLKEGACLGEPSLWHAEPSQCKVFAVGEERGISLLKLEPQVYRGLVQLYSKQAEAEKKEMILQVDFLNEVLGMSPDDPEESQQRHEVLHKLTSIMTRTELPKDQALDVVEDETFFAIQQGQVLVKNSRGTLHEVLKPGDTFGERALVGSMPRRCLVSARTTMTPLNDSPAIVYAIERRQMEGIIGPKRLQTMQEWNQITKVSPAIGQILRRRQKAQEDSAKRDTESHSNKQNIDKKKKRKSRRRGVGQSVSEHVLEHPLARMIVKETDKPAMYVVREGTVRVSFDDPSRSTGLRKAGDIFGHECFSPGTDGKEKKRSGFTVKLEGRERATIAEYSLESDSSSIQDGEDAEENANKREQGDSQPGAKKKQVAKSDKDSSFHSWDESEHSSTLELRNKVRQVVSESVSLEDLERIKLLGEGQFGEVWLVAADLFKTGKVKQTFALKSQTKVDDTRGNDALEAIRREIDVMKELNHPQLVDLVQTYEDDDNLYMLLGLVPGGELWDRIYETLPDGEWASGLSEEHAKFYTYVIADTIGYIHSQQYIFRDLKPENILIDVEGYPVLVDFGFAKLCSGKTYTFCGTPNYVPPEIVTNAGHDRAVDYWALGVTLYEMVTGENPFYFDGMDKTSLYDTICNEKPYPLKKDDCRTKELIDLVDRLLEKEPSNRLGMFAGGVEDILTHDWFAGLDRSKIRTKEWPAPWKPEQAEDANVEGVMTESFAKIQDLAISLDDDYSSRGSFASYHDGFDDDVILEEGDEDTMDHSVDEFNVLESSNGTVPSEAKGLPQAPSLSSEGELPPDSSEMNDDGAPSSLEMYQSSLYHQAQSSASEEDLKGYQEIEEEDLPPLPSKSMKSKNKKSPRSSSSSLSSAKKGDSSSSLLASKYLSSGSDLGRQISSRKKPVARRTIADKAKSRSRRSTITGALAGLGIDSDDEINLGI